MIFENQRKSEIDVIVHVRHGNHYCVPFFLGGQQKHVHSKNLIHQEQGNNHDIEDDAMDVDEVVPIAGASAFAMSSITKK